MIILHGFDDGSLECYNFTLANHDDMIYIDYTTAIKLVGMETIKRNLEQGYVSINLEHDGQHWLELQWG